MTAAAVLSLVAEGRVDLDAPVQTYLDPWPYEAVTVRHLLNQTSGLHFLTTLTAQRDTTRPVTTADLLGIVARQRPGLGFEPGAEFDYDNANYETLAADPRSRHRAAVRRGHARARARARADVRRHDAAPLARWSGPPGRAAAGTP